MQTFLDIVLLAIVLAVVYFLYTYYHNPTVEIKLRIKRLKVFNENYRVKTFWVMILAPILALLLLKQIQDLGLENLFVNNLWGCILAISLIIIIWYMLGHDRKCEKCKYLWGYLRRKEKVRDVVTDLDKTRYDSPGQVSRLGRTEEKYEEFKVFNTCRFCNFKKIEFKDNKWMIHAANSISKIGRK